MPLVLLNQKSKANPFAFELRIGRMSGETWSCCLFMICCPLFPFANILPLPSLLEHHIPDRNLPYTRPHRIFHDNENLSTRKINIIGDDITWFNQPFECHAFQTMIFNPMKGCTALKFMQFHFFLCPCGILHSPPKLGTF